MRQKKERMNELRNKLRNFIKNIVTITKGLDNNQINEKIFEEANRREKKKLETLKNAQRVPGVSL